MKASLFRKRANIRQRAKRWLKVPINKLRLRLALIASAGVIVSIGIIVLVIHRTQPETDKRVTAVEMESTVATTVGNATTINPQTPDTSAKWVKSIDVDDNDVAINGKVIETIDENQVFTGGIDVPLGWTVEYSTDPRTTPQQSLTFHSYNVANQQANPLSDITFLRFDTAATSTVKPSVSTPLTKPLDAYRFITDGQKFSTPIVFDHKIYLFAEGVRIATAGTYHLDCFDLVTYARCLGKSGENLFPTYFSANGASATTTTPLGTGTRTINTAETLQLVMDDGTYGHRGRVYMPVQVGNNYGVNCMDLELYANCGFTSLGSAAAPPATAQARIWGTQGLHNVPANPSWLSGFVQSGSKIYGHADDRDIAKQTVVCFDIRDPASGGGACSGYTAATTAITKTMRAGDYDHYANTTYQMIVGERLFWTVNYRHSNKAFYNPAINEGWPYSDTDYWLGTVTTCFNVTTRLPCPNYDFNVRVNDSTENNTGTFDALGLNIRGIASNTAMFPRFVGGNLAAVCYLVSGTEVTGSGPVDTASRCINPDTGQNAPGAQNPQVVPTGMVWPSNLDSWAGYIWRANKSPLTITDAADGHQKTYVTYNIMQPNFVRSAMSCYDWTTGTVCAGWPQMKYMYNVNGGVNTEMSLAYDGSCLIAFSAQGFVRSINPTTSESSCRVARARFTAKVNLNDYYCDGVQRAFSWRSARLAQGNPYDFQRLNVNVYDQKDGTLIKSGDIKNDGALDMRDINPGPTESLYLDINSSVYNTSPWAHNQRPYVATQADGDNVQYCYTTRAKTYAENIACDVTQLRTLSSLNLLSGNDTFVRNNVAAINYVQPSDKQCFKDLEITVTPDKTNVGNDESFAYTISVRNKANPDPNNRGSIPSAYDSKLASFKIAIPEGANFTNASAGGQRVGNDIVWQNESIPAGETQTYTATMRSPESGANSNSRAFVTQAVADYEDDTDQSDNTTSNNQVYFNDNAAPVVSDFQQTSDNLRAPATLRFTVTAVDDHGISEVQLFKGGDMVGQMQPSGTPDQFEITLTNQPAGTGEYRVRVIDDATPGASALTDPMQVTVTPENAVPTVVSFERTTGGSTDLKAPATLGYVARVSDDYTLPVVHFMQNGAVRAQLTKVNIPNDNRYSYVVPNLAAGTYTFTIRATDSEDPSLVSYSQPITVTILPANTAPVISSVGQTSQSLTAPATITMVTTVTDDYGLSKVELINGSSVVGQMQSTGIANQYSLTLTGQQAGTYNFKIRATDSDTPALATESGVYVVQVVSPPPPPPPPPPAPPANQTPTAVGLVQKIIEPRAPAQLTFEVYAEDDDGVAKVELFRGDENLGTMRATGNSYYTMTLSNYAAGSYSFRVRVTDNGNPPLATYSPDIIVEVLGAQTTQQPVTPSPVTPSRQEPRIDEAGRTVTYRGGVEQRLTPIAIRDSVPQSFVGAIEGAFNTVDRAVAPISPTTARVLPYTTLALLAGIGLVYAVLAAKQAAVRRRVSLLVSRFRKTEENRRNYLDLTAHYLNTPVAKMRMALELLQGKKEVPEKVLASAESRIKRLNNHVQALLESSQSTASISAATAESVQVTSRGRLLTSPGFILPVIGGIVITVILNALFVWSKKYDAGLINMVVQLGVGVAAVMAVAAGYSYMKSQKAEAAVADQELELERRIADSQAQFIQASGTNLAEDMAQIQTIASVVGGTKAGAVFTDGMATLNRAVDKLSYLNEITDQSNDEARDPIQIDILTQQAIEKFTPIAQQKGVELDISTDPNLRVNVDAGGFTQILHSTVDNAIKFTKQGGKVKVSIKQKGKKVIMRIKDNGQGIPKKRLDTLFEPFSRGTDSRQFDYEGMGIDLYMDKLIAERWGGSIAIKSLEGQGTDVEVTLLGVQYGV